MTLVDKLENMFISLLRYATLIGAAVAFIAMVITGGFSIKGLLIEEPIKPKEIQIVEREKDYKKDFSLNAFRADSLKGSDGNFELKNNREQSTTQDDPFQLIAEEDSEKIAVIIVKYYQIIDGKTLDSDELKNIALKLSVTNTIPNDAKRFYYDTLLDIFNQVDKEIPAIKKNPKKNVDIQKLIEWHASKVKEILHTINDENTKLATSYQERIQKYNEQKEAAYQYNIALVAAFTLFILSTLIFLMVKIELRLRPPKEVVDVKKEPRTEKQT